MCLRQSLIFLLVMLVFNDIRVLTEVHIYAPEHVEVDIDSTLTLECLIWSNEPAKQLTHVIWARQRYYDSDFSPIVTIPLAKDAEEQPSFKDSSLRRRANVSVIRDNTDNITVALAMTPQCIDAASYRCEGILADGGAPTPRTINVTISESPEILSLGESGDFECVAALGNPPGSLTWRMERRIGGHLQKITMGGMMSRGTSNSHCSQVIVSKLHADVTADDETISCMVTRPGNLSQADKRMPILASYPVKSPDIISLVEGRQRIGSYGRLTALEGQEVVLNCTARGRPTPSIKWQFWSEAEEKWIWLNSSLPNSLVLSNTNGVSSGKYVCVAENFVQGAKMSESREIRLRIKGRLSDEGPRVMKSSYKVTLIILFVAVLVVILSIGLCILVYFGRKRRKVKRRRKPIYNVEMEYRPIVKNTARRSFSLAPPLLANDNFVI